MDLLMTFQHNQTEKKWRNRNH